MEDKGNKNLLILAILTFSAVIAIVGYLIVSKMSIPLEVVSREMVQPINTQFDTELLKTLEAWSSD